MATSGIQFSPRAYRYQATGKSLAIKNTHHHAGDNHSMQLTHEGLPSAAELPVWLQRELRSDHAGETATGRCSRPTRVNHYRMP